MSIHKTQSKFVGPSIVLIFWSTCALAIDVTTLELGMSRKAFEEATSDSALHQFSALIDVDRYVAYSLNFGDSEQSRTVYYFVFKNDELLSIVFSNDFFHWTVKNNVSVQMPWTAEERMREILNAESLTNAQFQEDLAGKLKSNRSRRKGDSISNIWPLVPLISIDNKTRKRKRQEWYSQYNPQSVALSMEAHLADEEFGQPVFIVPGEESEVRVYGPSELLWRKGNRVHLGPINKRYFWIAVRVEAGKITRMFSNDLFDDENLVQPQFLNP